MGPSRPPTPPHYMPDRRPDDPNSEEETAERQRNDNLGLVPMKSWIYVVGLVPRNGGPT